MCLLLQAGEISTLKLCQERCCTAVLPALMNQFWGSGDLQSEETACRRTDERTRLKDPLRRSPPYCIFGGTQNDNDKKQQFRDRTGKCSEQHG